MNLRILYACLAWIYAGTVTAVVDVSSRLSRHKNCVILKWKKWLMYEQKGRQRYT